MKKKRLIVFGVLFLLLFSLVVFIPTLSLTGSSCCMNPLSSSFCKESSDTECCGSVGCGFVEQKSCADEQCNVLGWCVNDGITFICGQTEKKDCPGDFRPWNFSGEGISDCDTVCCKWQKNGELTIHYAETVKGDCEARKRNLSQTYRVDYDYRSCSGVLGNFSYGGLDLTVLDDATGQPVSTASQASAIAYGYTAVLTNGRYVFPSVLAVGRQKVTAYADGYETQDGYVDIVAGQTVPLTLRLKKASSGVMMVIEGVVTDAQNGSTLEGVSLYLFATGTPAFTNSEGRYHIEADTVLLGTQETTLQASKQHYQTTSVTLTGSGGGGLRNYNFILQRQSSPGAVCGNTLVEAGEQCDPPGRTGQCGTGVNCGSTCTCPSSCTSAGGYCSDFSFQCSAAGGSTLDTFKQSCLTEQNNAFNSYVCCSKQPQEVLSCYLGSTSGYPRINQTLFGTQKEKICKCGSTFVNASSSEGGKYCCFTQGQYVVSSGMCLAAGQLRGTVKNATGGGVGDALVLIEGSSLVVKTENYPAGYYVHESIPPGNVTVKVTKEGYVPVSRVIEIKSSEIAAADFVLQRDLCQNVSVYSFSAAAIKGRPFASLSWLTNCQASLREKDGFRVYRNEKSLGLLDRTARNFVDSDAALQWNMNYTYRIDVVSQEGNVTSTAITSFRTGNKFCENVTGQEEFCTSNRCFQGNCSRTAQEIQAGEQLSLRVQCDASNKVILAYQDIFSNCTRSSPESLCRSQSFGVTYCDQSVACELLGMPPAPTVGNVLGLYYHDYYDPQTCLEDTSKEPPLNKRYCMYDYWQSSGPYTNTNRCLRCNASSFCYDYQSKDACERDNCGYGALYGGACTWVDTYFSEFGKGICSYQGYTGDTYCHLCNANNSFFTNAHCTPEVCDVLGNCFSSTGNSSCLSCKTEGNCEAFTDEVSCTGGSAFRFTGEPQSKGITCASSTDALSSEDRCGIGTCVWSNGRCIKDANQDGQNDCLLGGDCIKDVLAPRTVVEKKPAYFSTKKEQMTFSRNDVQAKTYYCLADDSCCPVNDLSNLSLRLPNENYPLPQVEGYKYLMYYSIDENNNPEKIHKERIYIDTKPPQILFSTQVINSTLNDKESSFVLTLRASEHSRCKDSFSRFGNSSTTLFQGILNATPLTKQKDGLVDGVYLYSINCTDDYGNTQTKEQIFEIDRVRKIEKKGPDSIMVNTTSPLLWITTDQQNFYCSLHQVSPSPSVPAFFGVAGSGTRITSGQDAGDYYYEYKGDLVKNLKPATYVFEAQCSVTSGGAVVDEATLVFTVDTIAPTTSVMVDRGVDGLVAADEHIQYADSSFVLLCQDAPQGPPREAGCDGIQFCTSSSSCSAFEQGERKPVNGTSSFCFRSRDKAGNVEALNCTTYVFDTSLPIVDITSPVGGESTNHSFLTLTGSFRDDYGLRNAYFIIEDSSGRTTSPQDLSVNASTFSAPFVLYPGKNTVRVVVYDVVGNRGEATITMYYDQNPPRFSAVQVLGTNGTVYADMNTSSGAAEYGIPLVFSIQANDFEYADPLEQKTTDLLSVVQTLLKDGALVSVVSLPFTVVTSNVTQKTIYGRNVSSLEVGNYTARYVATDTFGITSTFVQSFSVQDTQPPTFTLLLNRNNTLGFGSYPLTVRASEPLDAILSFGYRYSGKEGLVEVLQMVNSTISALLLLSPDDEQLQGLDQTAAEFFIKARDKQGIIGTTIVSGKDFIIDTDGPEAPQLFTPLREKSYSSTGTFSLEGSTYQGKPEEWKPSQDVFVVTNIATPYRFDPGWKSTQLRSLAQTTPQIWQIATHEPFSIALPNFITVKDPGNVFSQGTYLRFTKNERKGKGFYSILAVEQLSNGWKKLALSPGLETTPSLSQDIEVWNQQGLPGWFTTPVSFSGEKLYLAVYGKDALGNTGTETAVYTLVLDNRVPAFSSQQPGDGSILSEQKPTISLDIDGTGSDIVNATLFLDNVVMPKASLTSIGPQRYKISFIPTSPLGEKTYGLRVEAEDEAGNKAVSVWSFRIDRSVPGAPRFLPHGTIKDKKPNIHVQFNASQQISVTSLEVKGDAAVLGNISLSAPQDYLFIPLQALSDGTYTVTAKAKLLLNSFTLGNEGSWSGTFIVDTTPPVIKGLSSSIKSSAFPAEIEFQTNEPAKCSWDFSDMAYGSMNHIIDTADAVDHDFVVGEFSRGKRGIFVRCKDTVGNVMVSSTYTELEFDIDAAKAPTLYLPEKLVVYSNTSTYSIIGSTFGGSTEKWVPEVPVVILSTTVGKDVYAYFTSYQSTMSYPFVYETVWDHTLYEQFAVENSSLLVNDPDNLIPVGKYLHFEKNQRTDYRYYKILQKIKVSDIPQTGKVYYRLVFDKPLEGKISGAQNLLISSQDAPPGFFQLPLSLSLGENYFYAQARDHYSFLGALSDVYTIIYDPSAPVLVSSSLHNGSIFQERSVNMSFVVDGTSSDVKNTTLLLDGAVIGYSQANVSVHVVSLSAQQDLSDGNHIVDLIVHDMAGNILRKTFRFTVDASVPSRPTLTPQGKFNVSMPIITYQFFDSGVVLSSAQIVNENGTIIDLTNLMTQNSGKIWTYTVAAPGLSDGIYYHSVKARKRLGENIYGNEGSWFEQFIIDRTPPVITVPSEVRATSIPVRVMVDANEPVICRYGFVDSSFGLMTEGNLTYAKKQELLVRVDRDSMVFVKCKDEAGNIGQGKRVSIVFSQSATACNDGIDNDHDTKTDFPYDPGCSRAADTDETDPSPLPECADGKDNDGDAIVDWPADSGCDGAGDVSEADRKTECKDGIDNDLDGAIDWPADNGCSTADDPTESLVEPACSDFLDNDGDGIIDYPYDPGCTDSQDNNESNEIVGLALPFFTVQNPVPGKVVNVSKISIIGTLRRATELSLYVNSRFKKKLTFTLLDQDVAYTFADVSLDKRQSDPASHGTNTLLLVAKNQNGEFSQSLDVIFDDKAPIITLLSPIDGYTGSNTPEVIIQTDESSSCSLQYVLQGTSVTKAMASQDRMVHSVTLSEGIDEETSVVVTCVDDIAQKAMKTYRIIVVRNKPSILDVSLTGSQCTSVSALRKDCLVLISLNTTLSVQTNETTECRYGFGEIGYGSMTAFASSSRVHETSLLLEDNKQYSISLICENQAGIQSDRYTLAAETDLTRSIQILNLQPQPYTNQRDPLITLQTIREARCSLLGSTQRQMERRVAVGSYNYSLRLSSLSSSLTPLTENTTYHFMARCESDKPGINSSVQNITFTTDFTLNKPVIYTPLPGKVVNASLLDVVGSAEPNSSIELYLNDVLQGIFFSSTGNFSFQALLAKEMQGVVVLKVYAVDRAGNRNFTQVSVVYSASGPRVLDTSPSANEILSTLEKAVVRFETDPFVDMDEKQTTVKVSRMEDGNLIPGVLTQDSSYIFSLRFTSPLTDGLYQLYALGVDELNRTGGKSLLFKIDHRVPTIVLTAPYTSRPYYGYRTRETSVNITGWVDSEYLPVLTTLVVDGTSVKFSSSQDHFLFSTGPFSTSYSAYNFTITSNNSLGNVAVTKGEFIIDRKGPEAIITVE